MCVFLEKQQAKAEKRAASQDIKRILGRGRMRSWQYLLAQTHRAKRDLETLAREFLCPKAGQAILTT